MTENEQIAELKLGWKKESNEWFTAANYKIDVLYNDHAEGDCKWSLFVEGSTLKTWYYETAQGAMNAAPMMLRLYDANTFWDLVDAQDTFK